MPALHQWALSEQGRGKSLWHWEGQMLASGDPHLEWHGLRIHLHRSQSSSCSLYLTGIGVGWVHIAHEVGHREWFV